MDTPETLQKKQELTNDVSTEVIMSPEDQREDQAELDNPQWQAESGFLTIDSLPQEIGDALPKDAQMIFIAAYNGIFEGSGDREAAMKTAWQTLEHSEQYVRGEDGKWQHTAPEKALHMPSPQSVS
jgi:cation transport regulator ChaB